MTISAAVLGIINAAQKYSMDICLLGVDPCFAFRSSWNWANRFANYYMCHRVGGFIRFPSDSFLPHLCILVSCDRRSTLSLHCYDSQANLHILIHPHLMMECIATVICVNEKECECCGKVGVLFIYSSGDERVALIAVCHSYRIVMIALPQGVGGTPPISSSSTWL